MPETSPVRTAYDRWSASYDAQTNPTRDLDAAALRAAPIPWAALEVLEIGCGTGKNSAWLAPRCRSVVGLDLSPGMLAIARTRVPGARFVEADLAGTWPIPDASVDAVLADLVLEHLADLGGPLRQAARVLRPGGWLWVSELHPYRQLNGGQAHFFDGDVRVDVPAHVHPVSELVNAAVDAGFSVVRLDEPAVPGADAVPRLVTLIARRAP